MSTANKLLAEARQYSAEAAVLTRNIKRLRTSPDPENDEAARVWTDQRDTCLRHAEECERAALREGNT